MPVSSVDRLHSIFGPLERVNKDIKEQRMHAQQIQDIILQAFPAADVSVISDDQVHFTARVISEAFDKKSRIQRHRMVHHALQAAVGEALGREIHALSLDLKTPQEAS